MTPAAVVGGGELAPGPLQIGEADSDEYVRKRDRGAAREKTFAQCLRTPVFYL